VVRRPCYNAHVTLRMSALAAALMTVGCSSTVTVFTGGPGEESQHEPCTGPEHWTAVGAFAGQGFGRWLSLGPDADGDGRADVVVGTGFGDDNYPALIEGERARLVSGVEGSALQSWQSDGPVEQASAFPASLGPDADGDGLGDVLLGLRGSSIEWRVHGPGEAQLVSGVGGASVHQWQGDYEGALFGADVTLGPDTNGDGVADALVVQGIFDTSTVRLYSGATGVVLHTFEGPWGFGEHAQLGPDVDGDDRGDVLIGVSTNLVDDPDWIAVYSGATGAELFRWSGPLDHRHVFHASLGGDVDGDGRGDIAIGSRPGDGPGTVTLWSGSDFEPLLSIDVDQLTAVALGPDADGDGAADLLVGTEDQAERRGAVMLFSGATGTEMARWQPPAEAVTFGWSIDLGPDADGDGLGDVVIAARRQDEFGEIHFFGSCEFAPWRE
jgi:hypothetical protein